MKIRTKQVGNVTVLEVDGKITIGAGDLALRQAVQQALDGGGCNLVLDLGQVTHIDSSGVGELVSAYTTATNRGCKLKLARIPAKVNDVLTITQLITVFDVYDSQDEAVSSFQ
ncbi:MAG: STAS domain-containing protein [Thermoanaerobaculia bacterium]